MALGLGSIVKLMRGGLGPDELAEVLAVAGVEMAYAPVDKSNPQAADAFMESIADEGCKVVELRGRMKDGGRIHALIVLNPSGQ